MTDSPNHLALNVEQGATLQWRETDGRWMTPRDRETMLRILREDPTREYRLAPPESAAIRDS